MIYICLFVIKLIVEDMPEVPTTELVPEEPEKLDLPDVPTKAPVASNAEITPTKRKGFCNVCTSNNCFIQRSLNSETLLLLQFLKNLWKLDSKVKNLIDDMDYNHSLETFSSGLLKLLCVFFSYSSAACKESSWSLLCE